MSGMNWPSEEFKDEPDKLEQHRAERAESGFSVFDWWSFDTYITGVIGNAVKQFANGRGYPGGFTQESWTTLCNEISEPLLKFSNDQFDGNTFDEESKMYDDAKEAMMKFSEHLGAWWD